MNIRNNLKASVAAIAFISISASAASAEKWDMPMAYAASNFHSENGANFAKCVGEKSGGALEIVTHASGSLYKGGEIKRAVQTGQAPIGERLLSAHANENPLFGLDSVPFLATSFEASAKLWEAGLPKIKEALDEQNLVYIYSAPWPPQGLYVNKAAESTDDLKGLKFRAYNGSTARIAELSGMAPVQIEAAEISQAFATGVAESMVSSGATGYDRKIWEHVSHFYDVQAWLPRNTVMVNKDIFEGLDDASKAALMDCGAEAAAAGTAKSAELASFYLKGLAEGGMTVGPVGDVLKGQLEEIGATMTAEWLEKAGDTGKAIIDAYKAN